MESPLFIRELWTLIFMLADKQVLYLVSLVCKDFHFTIMSSPRLSHESHKSKNNIINYALAENNSNLVSWAVNNGFKITHQTLRIRYTYGVQHK